MARKGEWEFGVDSQLNVLTNEYEWYAVAEYVTSDDKAQRFIHWSSHASRGAAKRDLARLRRMAKVK